MSRWTPEFVQRIRELAAEGYSAKQVAAMTFLRVGTLTQQCSARGIRFQRMPKSKRPRSKVDHMPPVDPGISPDERLRQAARADLDHQIALARAEAETAPLYRGGLS